jgi:hypothetical protein
MQKTDTLGTMYFAVNGIPVCTNTGNQSNPAIIRDDTGGFIICWTDSRNDAGDIYAQRFDNNGNAMWLANGIAVCTATDIQDLSKVVPDDMDGAIISWIDYRNDWLGDVYGQRIDQNGNVLWVTNGVAICTATGEQSGQQMISNGNGGAILAWNDTRNGTDDNIYAQNIALPENPTQISSITPEIPTQFKLHQNYPNPFNPSTTLKFAIPKKEVIRIDVLNALGQKVAVLINKTMPAGLHKIEFNGQDLPSGIYVYKFEAGEFAAVKKCLLLK